MKFLLLICIASFISSVSFSQSTDSLKVVSWNVFLRPAILKDRQAERVDSIAESILKFDADVVVLQEVFHKKSRKRLIESLSAVYPFHTQMGKTTVWGIPSGNCIFSKDSIHSERFVYYKRAMKADKMAKKGAIAIEITHQGNPITILGTHLQAGGGAEGAAIRKSQIDQIAELSRENDRSPVIFAGDFNIRYQDTLYTYLNRTLLSMNIEPRNKEIGTSNLANHDLIDVSGVPKWIDFILLRPNSKDSKSIKMRRSDIDEPRCLFQQKRCRISDHNPIITVFEW